MAKSTNLMDLLLHPKKMQPAEVSLNIFDRDKAGAIQSKVSHPDIDMLSRHSEKLAKAREGLGQVQTAKMDTKRILQEIEGAEKTFAEQVGSHHQSYGEIIDQHQGALKALEKTKEKSEARLKEIYDRRVAEIGDATGMHNVASSIEMKETLDHNYELAKKKLDEHAKDITGLHQEKIDELKKAATTLEEKSGVKAAEYMNKKSAGEVLENAAKKGREFALGKGEGFGKSALRIGGGLVGLGAVIVGVKNIGRGIGMGTPKTDQDGKPVAHGVGTLVLGIGELAGGAAITVASLTRGKGAGVAR